MIRGGRDGSCLALRKFAGAGIIQIDGLFVFGHFVENEMFDVFGFWRFCLESGIDTGI